MILARKLTTDEVTPMRVRQVGRAILKSQSEYCNVPLQIPDHNGVRLEEQLVGYR